MGGWEGRGEREGEEETDEMAMGWDGMGWDGWMDNE